MYLRERWLLRPLFLFVLISVLIGPLALARFPYLVYRYGGWAFVAGFILIWLLYGIPMISIELNMGHYLKGPIPLFATFPVLQSVGWGVLVFNIVLAPYQAFHAGHSAYLLYQTLTPSTYTDMLTCPANVPTCCGIDRVQGSVVIPPIGAQSPPTDQCPNVMTLFFKRYVNYDSLYNKPLRADNPSMRWAQAPERLGNLDWTMVKSNLLIWGLVLLFVLFGPATYCITGTLMILTTIGCVVAIGVEYWNYEGAESAGREYMTSNFNRLTDVSYWGDLSILLMAMSKLGTGVLPTFSSFNWTTSFNWSWFDIVVAAILVPAFYIALTFIQLSLYGAYSFGMSTDMNSVMSSVQDQSVFALMPTVLASLDAGSDARLYSILYFTAVLSIHLCALAATTEVINTAIVNLFEKCASCRRCWIYRPAIAICTTLALMCTTFIYCAEGGLKLHEFVGANIFLLYLAFVLIELLVVAVVSSYNVATSQRLWLSQMLKCFVIFFSLVILLLYGLFTALVIVYQLYLQSFDTRTFAITSDPPATRMDLYSWILAGLPLIVAVAPIPFVFLYLLCSGAFKKENICYRLFGPKFARLKEERQRIEQNCWDEYEMMPKPV